MKKIIPFKEVPLRQAGSSLFMRRMLLILDGMLFWLILDLGVFIITVDQWLRVFFQFPPRPVLATIIFVCLTVFTAYKIVRVLHKIKNFDQGLLGERMVAERLNELWIDGYYLIHDIAVGRMNIDHLLIGPAGIFIIETKTASKIKGEKSKIVHTKQAVFINGKKGYSWKGLWEAGKQKEYLEKILKSEGLAGQNIQPIVVYPGWFVEDDCKEKIWVLNDKYLIKKIRSLPKILSPDFAIKIRQKIEAFARREIEKNDYR